jgi:hypothetical protein
MNVKAYLMALGVFTFMLWIMIPSPKHKSQPLWKVEPTTQTRPAPQPAARYVSPESIVSDNKEDRSRFYGYADDFSDDYIRYGAEVARERMMGRYNGGPVRSRAEQDLVEDVKRGMREEMDEQRARDRFNCTSKCSGQFGGPCWKRCWEIFGH